MKVALRKAGPQDCGLLLTWVNEPDSLAAKLLTQVSVEQRAHEAWFAQRLLDSETFIWIIESDQKPIGQLRLTGKAGAYEVDIYVVRDQRHSGFALQALGRGIGELRAMRPEARVVRARVKPDNVSSQRLFERAGFALAEHNDDHLVYDLELA